MDEIYVEVSKNSIQQSQIDSEFYIDFLKMRTSTIYDLCLSVAKPYRHSWQILTITERIIKHIIYKSSLKLSNYS